MLWRRIYILVRESWKTLGTVHYAPALSMCKRWDEKRPRDLWTDLLYQLFKFLAIFRLRFLKIDHSASAENIYPGARKLKDPGHSALCPGSIQCAKDSFPMHLFFTRVQQNLMEYHSMLRAKYYETFGYPTKDYHSMKVYMQSDQNPSHSMSKGNPNKTEKTKTKTTTTW